MPDRAKSQSRRRCQRHRHLRSRCARCRQARASRFRSELAAADGRGRAQPSDRGRARNDARYQRALFQRARRFREEDLEVPGRAAQPPAKLAGRSAAALAAADPSAADTLASGAAPAKLRSSKQPRQRSAVPWKRRRKPPPSPIRTMARSASPSNTSCIATRYGRSPGATISAPKATGLSSSANALPPTAQTNCGRWWLRAE